MTAAAQHPAHQAEPNPGAATQAVTGSTSAALSALFPVPPAAPLPSAVDVALGVFGRWLHLDDPAPVLALAATVVANNASGDPVWLLIVGPPSGGKTEILSSCTRLPYVWPAATVSEAALLSGTSKKERSKNATGGLLRKVGDFGIILAKDFTSVLSQNSNTAASAMAALREVYDGRWDRPVGTDGGQVLTWAGKCGFLGGVTPHYDRYASVVNALGDRFLLLRLPAVDADAQARAALDQGQHETTMRGELAAAMTTLIDSADLDRVHAPLDDSETDRLVRLAKFTAGARTAVERSGYSGELLVVPQAEGPARLVKAMRRMHGALGALGVDDALRWSVLTRISIDCLPALRVPILRALLAADGPLGTTEIAGQLGMNSRTTARHLDDLAQLDIVTRNKTGQATNSPDRWEASAWLRENWPEM